MTTATPLHATRDALPWLGICPLLAGADTLAHGLLLGAVSCIVLLGIHQVPVRGAASGGAGITGLLLIGGGIAVILHLACEALALELALASGGLFALAALHGQVAGAAAGETQGGQAGPAWRNALAGAAALALVGALREWLGPAGLLPATAFFLLAGGSVALQSLRPRRA